MGVAILFVILFYLNKTEIFPANEEIEFSAPEDYSDLLSDSTKAGMTVDAFYNNGKNKSILILRYKNDYQILMYKIEMASARSITEIIKPVIDTKTSFSSEFGHRFPGFKFFYIMDTIVLNGKLFVSVFGDSVRKREINDSTIASNLKFNGIKLMSSENKVFFYINKTNPSGSKFCQIAFLKKEKAIFFLMISPIDMTKEIKPEIFDDIVKRN